MTDPELSYAKPGVGDHLVRLADVPWPVRLAAAERVAAELGDGEAELVLLAAMFPGDRSSRVQGSVDPARLTPREVAHGGHRRDPRQRRRAEAA